jgi:hypothetical protein
MKKRLLFTAVLTVFSVVSTMAQYNLFIDTTNNLIYEWSKNRESSAAWPYCKDASGNCIDPSQGGTCLVDAVTGKTTACDIDGAPLDDNDGAANGFYWTGGFPSVYGGGGTDSVGAVMSGGPYEGNTHLEFNYDFSEWWASGAFDLSHYALDPVTGTWVVPGKDLSAYNYLKLYWYGYSSEAPKQLLTFNFTGIGSDNASHNGPSVPVCDNSNTFDYVEKIIPLSKFLNGQLDVLTGLQKITFVISDTANVWWQYNGGAAGYWYMDAIQLVNITDSILVEGNGHAATPNYDFGTSTVGGTHTPTVFKIDNVSNSHILTLTGTPVISGTDAADFTVNTNPLSPIGADTSASFTITFNPSSNGPKTATLTIANSFSAGGSSVINLTGQGGAGSVTGVSYSKGTDSYTAFPSPFTDETVIKVNSTISAPMSIKVMDTKGIMVSSSEDHFTNESITVGKGLEKGIYFVQATYQNRMQVIKIVKI